jgi:tetratricopeptide (TPR) repeat protein
MRDFDSGERAQRLLLITWSLIGGMIGAFMGSLGAATGRFPIAVGVGGGLVIGATLVFVLASVVGGAAGKGMGSVLNPSGRSTRGSSELSLAESLVVRGRYGDAAAEYRRQAELAPADAEPRLRLARLYRDRLDDPELAVQWFRLARDAATDTALELLAVRELVDLFENRFASPGRALPELARYVELRSDAAGAEWAHREMARLRATIRQAGADE